MTQAEFVNLVLEKLGLSKSELGQALGKKNAYATVQAWVRTTSTQSKLGYDDTMAMLEMCGWLAMGRPVARRESPPDRLEEVAETVRALALGQDRILTLLEGQDGQAAQPSRRPARPKP